MIHPNNPALDIEALKREILASAAALEGKVPPSLPYRPNPVAAARRAEDIAIHLANVERFLAPRQALPPSLNRFPINRIKVLQRGLLKIFEYLFREQRLINQSLYGTLRLLQKSQQELARAIDSLHHAVAAGQSDGSQSGVDQAGAGAVVDAGPAEAAAPRDSH